MERETYDAGKLGAVLIILAAAIGVGLLIAGILRIRLFDNTNEAGEAGIRDIRLENIDYFDDNIVTGVDVINSLYKYSTDNLAVFVATQPFMRYCKTVEAADNDFNIGGADEFMLHAYDGQDVPMIHAYKSLERIEDDLDGNNEHSSDTLKFLLNDGGTVNAKFIQYGNVYLGKQDAVGSTGTEVTFGGVTGYLSSMYFNSNKVCYIMVPDLAYNSNGAVEHPVQNMTFANISDNNTIEYVAPGSRFASNLIRDLNGDILGIAFQQLPNETVGGYLIDN